MIRLLLSLLLMFQVCFASDITLEEAKRNGMLETLQNYINHNSVIADICVYEQEWIPPSEFSPKGELIQRATITHVHCGSLKIGQRIEYVHYIEEAPRFFGRFRSTVPGELRTFFYAPDGSEAHEDGMLKIKGDGHWGFRRVDDVFAQLFALELKSNPKLTTKRDQGGTAQPATRSESKSDSNKKPKPEAEMRSYYAGYGEDRASLRDNYQLPNPRLKASSGKAIEAARRLFKNVSFIGLTLEETLSILGDPKTISDYGIAVSPAPDSSLVYRFDSGFGGYQYTLHFHSGRVTKIAEEGLD